MALCEGYFVDVRSIERLVSFCRNNLSRSVLALNYWATSGGEILSSDTFYSGKVAVPAVFGGDDEMFLKIEKLVFGSGKRLGLENVVRPIAGCPTPFGSDLNVESLFNDVSMLRTVIENGDSGVFNSCLIDYILCNNGPVPGNWRLKHVLLKAHLCPKQSWGLSYLNLENFEATFVGQRSSH